MLHISRDPNVWFCHCLFVFAIFTTKLILEHFKWYKDIIDFIFRIFLTKPGGWIVWSLLSSMVCALVEVSRQILYRYYRFYIQNIFDKARWLNCMVIAFIDGLCIGGSFQTPLTDNSRLDSHSFCVHFHQLFPLQNQIFFLVSASSCIYWEWINI